MKKKFALILCVVMALTMLCGCDKKVSLEKYQQLFADMDILRMDEVSPELTSCKDHYQDEVFHDEYDPEHLVNKKDSYSGFYVIDMEEEESYQILKRYEEYLLGEGFVCVNGGEEGEESYVADLQREDDVVRIAWYGIVQWEDYEGKSGMSVVVYK